MRGGVTFVPRSDVTPLMPDGVIDVVSDDEDLMRPRNRDAGVIQHVFGGCSTRIAQAIPIRNPVPAPVRFQHTGPAQFSQRSDDDLPHSSKLFGQLGLCKAQPEPLGVRFIAARDDVADQATANVLARPLVQSLYQKTHAASEIAQKVPCKGGIGPHGKLERRTVRHETASSPGCNGRRRIAAFSEQGHVAQRSTGAAPVHDMFAAASLAYELYLAFEHEEYARRCGTLAPQELPGLVAVTDSVLEEDGPGLRVVVEKIDTFVSHGSVTKVLTGREGLA